MQLSEVRQLQGLPAALEPVDRQVQAGEGRHCRQLPRHCCEPAASQVQVLQLQTLQVLQVTSRRSISRQVQVAEGS